MTASPQLIPILVYHSIADPHDHYLRQLSLPIALFERQLVYLRDHGFNCVDLHEVQQHLRDGRPLPRKAFAITFDDGYLDNWVHALPLLERHGMKATLFVTTDFVDPRNVCRPTLKDVWAGRLSREALEWWGHVSWAELECMQASGVIDVQSHTRTHNWYFASDRIVDFHHPQADYPWLYWLSHPAEKYRWLTQDFRALIPLGRPVYEHRQTLLGERYHDDPAIAEATVRHVRDHGAREFFARADWRDELRAVARAQCRGGRPAGRSESTAQYRARILDEMLGSKAIIEERLGKPVDILCWPCGDYTSELQRMAIEECGFCATVNVARVSNRFGDDPRELRRVDFEQAYLGPWRNELVYWNFVGMMNYRSGRSLAYPVAPVTRRLMLAGRALRPPGT